MTTITAISSSFHFLYALLLSKKQEWERKCDIEKDTAIRLQSILCFEFFVQFLMAKIFRYTSIPKHSLTISFLAISLIFVMWFHLFRHLANFTFIQFFPVSIKIRFFFSILQLNLSYSAYFCTFSKNLN